MALRPTGRILVELRGAVEHWLGKGMTDKLQTGVPLLVTSA
jgi:hypothetical protein